MQYILAYLATATLFFPLDFLWLGPIAGKFYRSRLGDLIADPVNIGAAIGFYLIYIAGIVIFAVAPAISKQSLTHAALFGALFGFFCYATYDMTNLATLRSFPVQVALVDMLWGTMLTGISAAGGYVIAISFLK